MSLATLLRSLEILESRYRDLRQSSERLAVAWQQSSKHDQDTIDLLQNKVASLRKELDGSQARISILEAEKDDLLRQATLLKHQSVIDEYEYKYNVNPSQIHELQEELDRYYSACSIQSKILNSNQKNTDRMLALLFKNL